jgi:hypothetical protein
MEPLIRYDERKYGRRILATSALPLLERQDGFAIELRKH